MTLAAFTRTDLTWAQHARLDGIEKEDPGAKVIGWHAQSSSPLVRRSHGGLQRVSPVGRLLAGRGA